MCHVSDCLLELQREAFDLALRDAEQYVVYRDQSLEGRSCSSQYNAVLG